MLQVQQEIDASPNGQMQSYDDIFCGSEYLQVVADGKVRDDDIVRYRVGLRLCDSLPCAPFHQSELLGMS